MIKEPLFLSVPTIRDYEQMKMEQARTDGWNDAMRYIFGQEIHATKLKAECWVMRNYGERICDSCQNREICSTALAESILEYCEI